MKSKKRVAPRILAVVLLLAILTGLVPWTVLAAHAATTATVVQPAEKYPEGITVNVFDYWLENQNNSDINNPANYQNKGINQNHVLNFGSNMSDGINAWTRSAAPRMGIVQNVLDANGFPKLAYENSTTKLSADNLAQGQSLDYLFNGDDAVAGKQAYMNVGGLLQQDEQGYYYYNCRQNFAAFNQQSKEFQLYSAPAVKDTKQVVGQFFPFNTADQVFSGTELNCDSTAINHYFGLNMVTRFQQPEDGIAPDSTDSNPIPVTYAFTGDDDVWVFIDDVLVADLGGIHDATSVEIDFQTGNIYIFDDRNNNGVFDSGEPRYNDASATLKSAYEAAGEGGSASDWNGNTFADNSYHTMKFFYLERGNYASNMNMKFNLDTVLESQIEKTDQDGQPVANAEFALYEADDSYNKQSQTPVAKGVTDQNGVLTFYDSEEMVLMLSDLNAEHYVLEETKVPDGYRNGGDIHLRVKKLRDGTKVLLSANAWDTGAYAMPTVRVKIQRAETQNSSHQVTGVDGTNYSVENGLVFAAVMKGDNIQYGSSSIADYHIVYGDPVNGWQISKATGSSGVAEAAQAMTQASADKPVTGLYTFKLNGINQYYTDIKNLPGDINDYAVEKNDGATYTLGYFYAPVDALGKITSDNITLLKTDSFYHEFAMRLMAPNIQNRLLVQKVDQETNTAKDGATFALYNASDVTVNSDGSYVLAPNAQPAYAEQTSGSYDIDNNGNQVPGMLAFTGLHPGSYYLIETQPPDGYSASTTAVQVVVDDSGVHVNAGTADDNVSVHLGLGRIVKSMVQFAVDDGVEATLNEVTATLKTSNKANYADIDWSQAAGGESMALSYSEAAGVLEYGPATENGPVTLNYDSGWGLLDIKQLPVTTGTTTANGSKVQQLGDQSLNNLYSGTTLAIVGNTLKDPGELVIKKTVAQGIASDADKSFAVQLSLGAGGLHNGKVVDQNTGKDISFENNLATLHLKDGESIRLSVPDGVVLNVEEVQADAYDVAYKVNDGAATAAAPTVTTTSNNSQSVTIINTRQQGSYTILDGAANLNLTKQVDPGQVADGAWPDDASFQFKIEAQNGAPMPAKDTITISKNDDGSNTNSGAFGDILFEQAGTYSYIISEVPGNRNDMVYDSHRLTLTVTVDTADDGSLRVSNVSASGDNNSSGDDARLFVNTLQATGGDTEQPGSDPDQPSSDPDGPDALNTVDHYSYIVGYPEDYRSGEKSDDESLWPVKPQGNITRGEVASIYYRLLKKDIRDANTTDTNSFSDVNSDDWFNVPVSSLAQMGIISGYEDGTFRPNAPITRAEFAAISARFFENDDVTYRQGLFSDISGSEWYANVIAKAVSNQLIGGYPDGTMQPNSTITRAESCAIVNRTLDRQPNAAHLQPWADMRTWPDNHPDSWYYADIQEATNGHDYEWIDDNGKKEEAWTEILPDFNWSER